MCVLLHNSDLESFVVGNKNREVSRTWRSLGILGYRYLSSPMFLLDINTELNTSFLIIETDFFLEIFESSALSCAKSL